jgi:hypothetical protein
MYVLPNSCSEQNLSIASSSKPPFHAGQDILAEKSKYRTYWEAEEFRKSQVMRSSGICIVWFQYKDSGWHADGQFEGWEMGILTVEMAQAMLSGCVVAMAPPQVYYGQPRLDLPISR